MFVPILLFTFCKEDEEAKVNEIYIGSEVYVPVNNFVFDVGPDRTATHYAYQFFISDGEISYDRQINELSLDQSATFILSFLAASLGSSSFEDGVFDIYPTTYIPNSSNYFALGFFDALDGFTPKEINDGTIVIRSIPSGFEFDFEVNVQGRKLEGYHSGPYEIQPLRPLIQ